MRSFFFILSITICLKTFCNTYYVSNAGNDDNSGLSYQFPFKSIDKLNSINFNAGDSILFKSGNYWEGMFWIKGSGTDLAPIVVDAYGGSEKPVINGNGFQSCILIYNNDNIIINGIELYNSFSHIDNGPSTIDEQTP